MKYILTFIMFLSFVSVSFGANDDKVKRLPGGGGPTIMYNFTTKSYDMLPQCFPRVYYSLFLAGDISAMYENQKACQEQRKIDFGF